MAYTVDRFDEVRRTILAAKGRQNLTNKQIAESVGVTANTIGRWLQDPGGVTARNLDRLGNVLFFTLEVKEAQQ